MLPTERCCTTRGYQKIQFKHRVGRRLAASRYPFPNASIGPAGGPMGAARQVFLFSPVFGKKAKHIDRPGRRDVGSLCSGEVAGGGLEPFRGRASRRRRKPVWADEQDDAAFGAQGAEPATGALSPPPATSPRVKHAHTHSQPLPKSSRPSANPLAKNKFDTIHHRAYDFNRN